MRTGVCDRQSCRPGISNLRAPAWGTNIIRRCSSRNSVRRGTWNPYSRSPAMWTQLRRAERELLASERRLNAGD